MSTTSTVAVVLHFRTPEMTLACLKSLIDAGVRRAVLVDNSADDGMSLWEMTHGMGSLRATGLRIDIESPSRNLGFAAGVNLGIHRALAEGKASVLLLNSDARLNARTFEAMQAALSKGTALVVPKVGPTTHILDNPHGYNRWLALQIPRWLPGCVPYLSGACMLLSERIVHPKLFDEEFFFYGEDVELSDRLARRGEKITLLQDCSVEHHASGSAKNGSWFYEYQIVRGHWLLARKLTRGNCSYAVALVCRVPVLTVRALVRSARARSLRPVRALFLATLDIVRRIERDVTPPQGAGSMTAI